MLGSIRKELSVSLLAISAFALPAIGHAVELNTSPIYAENSQSYHACNVTNISNSTVTLGIQIVNSSGIVIKSLNTTLNAGTSTELATAGNYSGFAYCRFNLGSEPKANFR
jgi:hypothetical protein